MNLHSEKKGGLRTNDAQTDWLTRTRVLGIIVIVGSLLLPVWWTTGALKIRENLDWNQIWSLFATLAIISAFVERTMEVFVAALKGPQRAQLTVDVQLQKQVVNRVTSELKAIETPGQGGEETNLADPQVKGAELESATRRLFDKKKVLEENRAATAKETGWVGLVIGILISAAGVRSLAWLIDANSLCSAPLSTFQIDLFRVLDVFVTGGLIAGGTKVIHQLAAAVEELLSSLRPSLKN